MNLARRRTAFRAILNGHECVHPASVFDAMSARIALDLGYEIGMFAGSVASLTVLGAPDYIVLTLTEFAQQIHRISRGGELPLMVDADHGYGNALNVMRTVEELETAGVCGLSIEDTELPPPFGAGTAARLLSIEEGTGKMRAAMAAKPDPEMVVFGRTSAMSMSGTEDAVARVKAYAGAGVDAIFLVGVEDRAQLEAARGVTDLPLMIGGGGPELEDREYLASRGVRIALQGHAPIAAAMRAVHDTMLALRAGTAPSALTGVPDVEFMRRITRQEDYDGWREDFL